MYTKDLYDEILLKPLQEFKLNKLLIVSGYATSAMSFRHLENMKKLNHGNVGVELIVGMQPKDGIALNDHAVFKSLADDHFPNNFKCRYITGNVPVHSKVYVWCHDNDPKLAFAGSANYTQTAFCLKIQEEAMVKCVPAAGVAYFKSLLNKTVLCNHVDAERLIQFYKYGSAQREHKIKMTDNSEHKVIDFSTLDSVKISLLGSGGDLPKRSGLNWGQRPEENRDPNQAYIRLTSKVYNTKFFPPNTVHFAVLTDDENNFVCTRAQQNGKAIHTPHDNTLFGKYFRDRLGVKDGMLVTKQHLEKHGRTDVSFYKIDNETYYMDFSPN